MQGVYGGRGDHSVPAVSPPCVLSVVHDITERLSGMQTKDCGHCENILGVDLR
jgi:hypothetical protein